MSGLEVTLRIFILKQIKCIQFIPVLLLLQCAYVHCSFFTSSIVFSFCRGCGLAVDSSQMTVAPDFQSRTSEIVSGWVASTFLFGPGQGLGAPRSTKRQPLCKVLIFGFVCLSSTSGNGSKL